MTGAVKQFGVGGLVIAAALMGLALLQTPSMGQIEFSPEALAHIGERHGEVGLRAIQRTLGCELQNRRAWVCLQGKYGVSVVFWCQPPGSEVCPGIYASIGGCGKTAFVRPCSEWRECK